ncbi:MotE family protein [Paenibacillus sp. MBLB4367]|uniref:MotE family protein n=1 Tax=Paenibacillus sp. MBLB4367 TaxID=3384767 RepID=UPI003907F051
MDTELEKSELSAFERFLYWFFIPIVFTGVLLVVLLKLFDYDVMDNVLKTANKIPFVSSVLPEPKSESKKEENKVTVSSVTTEPEEQKVSDLNKSLTDMTEQLKKAEAANQQKDQSVKELQAKNTALEDQLKTKAKSDEDYLVQIKQTADMFAKMNPTKAGPIFENLTLSERVLVMAEMKPEERVKILEKMDPKKAAETSISLKDSVPVKDREIAALQERLKQMVEASATASSKLSKNDLGQTFANMTPKSAATVLMEMNGVNQAKVIEILNATDNQARSKIMTALADLSKETAAAITARLAQ